MSDTTSDAIFREQFFSPLPDDLEFDAPIPDPGQGVVRSVAEWVLVAAGAVLVALVIKTFVLQAFYIPSESMEPTLLVNDRVLVNKFSYRVHDVNRGDVVVFSRPPGMATEGVDDLIKRVVGLPGEQVYLDAGRVYINGRLLSEPYLPAGTTSEPLFPSLLAHACEVADPCLVPAGSIWVMGDHRNRSADSRYFGPVPTASIVGRASVVIWPLGRATGL